MKKVALLFGGYSEESIVSLKSAKTIENNLKNVSLYKVEVTKGSWACEKDGEQVEIDKSDFSATFNGVKVCFDFAFIMIHGTPGEDGKLAAYFDMIGIPYSSSSHIASSLSFNKAFCNKYLRSYGVRVADSQVIYRYDDWKTKINEVKIPCFIKPNNGGSSLGTHKVLEREAIIPALESAFEHDEEVIVEDFVAGREFTCGVVELNGEVKALQVTEIIPQSDFFDFEQKYSKNGAKEVTPASIDKDFEEKIKSITVNVFKYLNLSNMARVDFIGDINNLYMIEVNTIPGFSEASILPQQLATAGIEMSDFLGTMISKTLR